MDAASGAIGLLVGAISYMVGVCAAIGPAEMTLPTPCADWDLAMLLGHLCRSMADLETALRTGQLDLEEPASAGGDPVEGLRDWAAGASSRRGAACRCRPAWWPAPGRWRSRCTAGTSRPRAPGLAGTGLAVE